MTGINIRFSSALRAPTGETRATVDCAGNAKSALDSLCEKYGDAFRKKVFDEEGNLRGHVAVYKNGEDLRFSQGLQTSVSEGDELLILPAVSGG